MQVKNLLNLLLLAALGTGTAVLLVADQLRAAIAMAAVSLLASALIAIDAIEGDTEDAEQASSQPTDRPSVQTFHIDRHPYK